MLEAAFAQQPCNAELSHQIGVCYSGGCRRHSQVSLRLAIAYFERALDLIGIHGPGEIRAKYLDSLGNAHWADGEPAAAVPLLEEAARIYQQLGLREDWARTEYNLGNACCEAAATGVPSMWNEAVGHYSVGGGENGYQFGGREGARCGVTLWPTVGRGKREEADCFLSQAGLSSLLTSGVR